MSWFARAGRAGAALDEPRLQITRSVDLDGETGERSESFEVLDNMRWLMVRLRAAATGGEIRWALLDPSGMSRRAGTLAAGERCDESVELDAIAGRWTVSLVLRRAFGSYNLRFRSWG